MATNLAGPSSVAVRDPAPLLWTVAAACWTATVFLSVVGDAHLAGHHHGVGHGSLPGTAQVGAFLLTWTVMVGAMMLPTMVPMSRHVVMASVRTPRAGYTRMVFALAYLVVWLGFGLVALAADLSVRAAGQRWPWLGGDSRLVLGALVAGVAVFQLSRLKDRCLTACRDPMNMLLRHDHRREGVWRLGLYNALNCLGCCGALMLLMFGAGVASLAVMALLSAVMVAETTTTWGTRLVTPVGAALLVAAVAVVL